MSASLALPAMETGGHRRLLGLSAARQRLLLLYALATGPLLLLLVIGAWVDRTQALRAAGQQAENIARMGALQHGDMVQEAENVLTLLAQVPEVRGGGPGCHAILRGLEASNPRLSNFTVVTSAGRIICSSLHEGPAHNVSDNPMFKRTILLAPNETATSDVLVGRTTGRPTMVVIRTLEPTANAPAVAQVGVSLNLHWFQHLSRRLSGAPDTVMEIIDTRANRVVARSSGDRLIPAGYPGSPSLIAAIRDSPTGGSVETDGDEGPATIGFAPLPGTTGSLFITTALPKTMVLASSNYHLTLNLLGFLGAAIAAVMLAWLAADRSLLRPIRQLVATTAALGNGDLQARVGALPGAVEELRTLGSGFDAMAERLRARDERIAAMGQDIARSEEHHRLLANNAGDMLARFDSSFICTYISPASREVTGYEPNELVSTAMVDIVAEEDRPRVRNELLRPLMNGAETARCTYRVLHKLGNLLWIETFARRLRDASGFVTVARDVSLQKELEGQLEAVNQQLRVQALQDPLTGIANRRRFDEVLGAEFRRAQRLREPLSLLMVDIDYFKSFNDSFGHIAGDDCLRIVARTLEQALRRPGDMVGRYGGEEFAILLPSTTSSGAAVIAERLRRAVCSARLAECPKPHATLTVSIGSATMMPEDDEDGPATLVERADIALYAAKRDGRNCVRTAAPGSEPACPEALPSFA